MYSRFTRTFQAWLRANFIEYDLGYENKLYNVFLRAKDIENVQAYFQNHNQPYTLEYFDNFKDFATLYFKGVN